MPFYMGFTVVSEVVKVGVGFTWSESLKFYSFPVLFELLLLNHPSQLAMVIVGWFPGWLPVLSNEDIMPCLREQHNASYVYIV